jgi:hypothetical protein
MFRGQLNLRRCSQLLAPSLRGGRLARSNELYPNIALQLFWRQLKNQQIVQPCRIPVSVTPLDTTVLEARSNLARI